MKRRSVTFTDTPPEVIDNDNDSYNIYTPLPTGNIFLYLQLAKIERRQRRYALETQHQLHQYHYSRSVPNLNKQHHYLSVESKFSKSHFNINRGKNFFQQRQRMDPVYLSIPDLAMTVQPRLRAAIESVRIFNKNVTKMDTSWNLYGLCRKGRGEKLLQCHYGSVSDYFLNTHRNAIVSNNAAAESSVKNIIDIASESSIKDNVDHRINKRNDSNNDTVTRRGIIQQYKSSVSNDRNCIKNDAINNASDSIVCYSYTHDNRNDSNVNSDVENIIKSSGRVNNSDNDYGKLTERFLQRYNYHYLNNCKKFNSAAETVNNWFLKNVGYNNDNGINCRCYSLLNKPLQRKDCHQRHHSSDARNISSLFTSTTSHNSKMRNVISKHQWYCYPSVMYSKTQLVDEMAKHIAECLEQFNTGLDKVLQARQLLETSQELPVDDRETMLRLLNQAMRTSLKRMEYNDDRYEPDGRHSESPNSLGGQRQCAPIQQLCGTNDGNANFHNITNNVDPAEFFQQHGQQLLALLQQNMAKQN
ncbi:hypothetical protein ACH3XW_40915 [Acanthocheilonema viteae]